MSTSEHIDHRRKPDRGFKEQWKFVWELISEDFWTNLIPVVGVLVLMILVQLVTGNVSKLISDFKTDPNGTLGVVLPKWFGAIIEAVIVGILVAILKRAGETANDLKEAVKDVQPELFTSKLRGVIAEVAPDPIKSFFDALKLNHGGIVIGADEKEYLRRLEDLLPWARKSFRSTLRGGRQPAWNLNWFFVPTYGVNKELVLKIEQKQEYLRLVNNKKLDNKTRLLILRRGEMISLLDDKRRGEFLHLNDKVSLFSIKPKKLENALGGGLVKYRGSEVDVRLSPSSASFIYEDYALIDDDIALKHNGQNSLYLGVKPQIQNMLAPFWLLEEEKEWFQEIDKDGVRTYDACQAKWIPEKWEDWKLSSFADFLVLVHEGQITTRADAEKLVKTDALKGFFTEVKDVTSLADILKQFIHYSEDKVREAEFMLVWKKVCKWFPFLREV